MNGIQVGTPEAQALSDEFHMIMGYSIAAWSRVDAELFRIFQDCLGPLDQSAIIYYRTPGLDVRLGVTDELVKTTLLPSWERPGTRDPRIRAWRKLFEDFRKLLSVRRRIAHQPVHFAEVNGYADGYVEPGYFTALDLWLEIHVSKHERLRDSAAKLPPLRAVDLREHLQAVDALKERLASFYSDVLTKPAPTPSPPATPPAMDSCLKKDQPTAPRRRRSSRP